MIFVASEGLDKTRLKMLFKSKTAIQIILSRHYLNKILSNKSAPWWPKKQKKSKVGRNFTNFWKIKDRKFKLMRKTSARERASTSTKASNEINQLWQEDSEELLFFILLSNFFFSFLFWNFLMHLLFKMRTLWNSGLFTLFIWQELGFFSSKKAS